VTGRGGTFLTPGRSGQPGTAKGARWAEEVGDGENDGSCKNKKMSEGKKSSYETMITLEGFGVTKKKNRPGVKKKSYQKRGGGEKTSCRENHFKKETKCEREACLRTSRQDSEWEYACRMKGIAILATKKKEGISGEKEYDNLSQEGT